MRLVRVGGIQIAVADHQLSPFQIGDHRIVQVLCARRGVKERLADVRHLRILPREDDAPDLFGDGRTARFARQHVIDARLFQMLFEQGDLAGLPRAFAPFKRDEFTLHSFPLRP